MAARDGAGADVSGACSTRAARSAPSATASPIRAIRSRRRWRSRRSKSTRATASSSAAAQMAPQFQARLARARTASAGRRGARARASSARSSWSPTRPAKRSFEPKAGVGAARGARLPRRKDLIVRFLPGDVLSICPPLDHLAGRDRRAVRSARPRARPHARLGAGASACWRPEPQSEQRRACGPAPISRRWLS